MHILYLHFLHPREVKIVFNNLVYIVYTQSYILTHQSAITPWLVPSCNNAGV